MNAFPQARLQSVRALRTGRAERDHAVRLRELEGARMRLDQHRQALDRLVESRRREHARLAGGLTRPADICRTVSYIEALDERIDAHKARLAHLQEAVAQARETAAETARALAAARQRQDALDAQAGQWRNARRLRAEALEEDAAQELFSRPPQGGRP
ncbi:MAG: hypothetical protein ACXIUZ_06125 [Lysobacteraceae bacterium]